ncbi:hypothetical protein [Sphingomonas qomolangmaensis]|uniref:Uncharacterized protein n=1 Tax=Sphingomonas qomolangmaensis TaxID=2918765 RepID=A0ABY5L8B0_9SPHN|nr:hypothetical protein [Sphingomonas qomolangmaensis]UUL82024.1 hypothetical protein NMP03_12630 [Sphingomonas qomolangmaensis]
MKTIDWFGRLLLLGLSSFATLFLIGAMVQVSNTGTPGPPPGERVMSSPQARPVDAAPPRSVPPRATPTPLPIPTPQDQRELLRWAEALTYAVTALALFVAAGVVVLLRLTATLSRIADR